MAVIKTCDRCGRQVVTFAKSLVSRSKGNAGWQHERYELCTECAQAFMEWIGKDQRNVSLTDEEAR